MSERAGRPVAGVVRDGSHHAVPLAEGLLTERQAAAFLGVSPRTLWGLADQGEIPFIRIGRTTKRYAVEDLRAYCDRQRVVVGAVAPERASDGQAGIKSQGQQGQGEHHG